MTLRLVPFQTSFQDGVRVGHIGGGVYKVLNSDGIVRTKHVCTYEDRLPGTTLINTNRPQTGYETYYDRNSSDTSRSAAMVEQTRSDSDDEQDGKDPLTYVPPQIRTIRESDGN